MIQPRILVIAGTFMEYCLWLQMNSLGPDTAIYADCASDLELISVGVVVRTGEYYKNPLSNDPALLEIEERLKQRWRSE